ncbi:MAG: response regulator transcription factor [Lachnospiraceae bacterium]|nr:response regulator transcription factor [Lachnospiraceae bacterium]
MNIAICDDMPKAVEQIKNIVEKYLEEQALEANILEFYSGKDVLAEIENIQILFLDIEMPEMDGIAVGGKIRQRNIDCKIIMATGREDRIKEAFKISAYRFVGKPFIKEEVIEAVHAAIQAMLGYEVMELYEKRMVHHVLQRDMQMIKAYDSFVEIAVGNTWMRKDISIKRLLEILDTRLFFQVDRRYVVNIRCIKQYDYKEGKIDICGEVLKVSRRRKKIFDKVYRDFDITYGGWV